MFVAIGFISVPIALVAYTRINAKRQARWDALVEKGEPTPTAVELRAQGDKALDFRYVL